MNVSVSRLLETQGEKEPDENNIAKKLADIRVSMRYAKIVRAVVGAALLVCGAIGLEAQRIVDTVFTANGWQLARSGVNIPVILSCLALAAGAALCVHSLKEHD